MKLNKTFLTLGLAAALLQMPASSFAQNAGGNRQNPLLVKSSLPFGAPDFSKIQESQPSRTPSSLTKTAVCCWSVFPVCSSVLPAPTKLQALLIPRRR